MTNAHLSPRPNSQTDRQTLHLHLFIYQMLLSKRCAGPSASTHTHTHTHPHTHTQTHTNPHTQSCVITEEVQGTGTGLAVRWEDTGPCTIRLSPPTWGETPSGSTLIQPAMITVTASSKQQVTNISQPLAHDTISPGKHATRDLTCQNP